MLMNSNSYILKVSNLGMRVKDQTILENINFQVKEGTTLAIVGPNGAGKSMLFRALINLLPYTGKIEWTQPIKIGYVPQRLSIGDIPISVKEFLLIKSTKNIEETLNSVGLDRSIQEKSLGVLSGGQLQRVLIAWAIIDNPNILLFDEPTTGVDLDSEEIVYKMLSELKRKKKITLLLISHDIHIIREFSDFVLAIHKCVTFFGESKSIMEPEVQKIIYGEPVCLL